MTDPALQGDDYVREMWNYICPELFKSLQTEMEPDILAVIMESVATCVEVCCVEVHGNCIQLDTSNL